MSRSKMAALQEKCKDLRCLGIGDLRKTARYGHAITGDLTQLTREQLFKMVAYRLQDAMGLGSERADKAEAQLHKEINLKKLKIKIINLKFVKGGKYKDQIQNFKTEGGKIDR